MTAAISSAIIDAVARERGITRDDIVVSRRRLKPFVSARIEVALRLFDAGYHTAKIARVLRRDHTTITYYLGRSQRGFSALAFTVPPPPPPASRKPPPASALALWHRAPPPAVQPPPAAPPLRKRVRYAGYDETEHQFQRFAHGAVF